jgi:hypothetical protein
MIGFKVMGKEVVFNMIGFRRRKWFWGWFNDVCNARLSCFLDVMYRCFVDLSYSSGSQSFRWLRKIDLSVNEVMGDGSGL